MTDLERMKRALGETGVEFEEWERPPKFRDTMSRRWQTADMPAEVAGLIRFSLAMPGGTSLFFDPAGNYLGSVTGGWYGPQWVEPGERVTLLSDEFCTVCCVRPGEEPAPRSVRCPGCERQTLKMGI